MNSASFTCWEYYQTYHSFSDVVVVDDAIQGDVDDLIDGDVFDVTLDNVHIYCHCQ